jgi:hypothetical protein
MFRFARIDHSAQIFRRDCKIVNMKRDKTSRKKTTKKGHHEYPLPGEINADQKRQNKNARQQADTDMSDDAEFTAHSKNDDLDEGESARLGEESTDLV